MSCIQLSLFQSRNLSVGFRQTAYLPLWHPVNCFGCSDECKCVSFNKFEFQRKTNNCFHILVHFQPAKSEKSKTLFRRLAACQSECVPHVKTNSSCWKHSLPQLFPPQCIAIQLTTDANQEQIILFNTEASAYLNTHPLGYLMTALPVLICSSLWQKYSLDLLAWVAALSL